MVRMLVGATRSSRTLVRALVMVFASLMALLLILLRGDENSWLPGTLEGFLDGMFVYYTCSWLPSGWRWPRCAARGDRRLREPLPSYVAWSTDRNALCSRERGELLKIVQITHAQASLQLTYCKRQLTRPGDREGEGELLVT